MPAQLLPLRGMSKLRSEIGKASILLTLDGGML